MEQTVPNPWNTSLWQRHAAPLPPENKGSVLLSKAYLNQALFEALQAKNSIPVAQAQLATVLGKDFNDCTRLEERTIEYISPHDATGEIFDRQLSWNDAIKIAETTNISVSDAMILNALQATKCPFIVSLDFDIGYAALSTPMAKDVVMPDENAKEYRAYHFSH